MSESQRRVIFLHIPKTAGQSVHAYLTRAFRTDEICPARLQHQMAGLSIPAIQRFKLFSGHLDWAQFDCLDDNPFVFTILREPIERILSFYYFLRREAQRLSPEELVAPHRRGMRAALECSPDEYFCGGAPDLRAFLDDHYDNFYTYFFAGRTFHARSQIIGRAGQQVEPDHAEILAKARANLAKLAGVYRLTELARLQADLAAIGCVVPGKSMVDIRANVGEGDPQTRMAGLAAIGPCQQALQRLNEMVRYDNELWSDPTIFSIARNGDAKAAPVVPMPIRQS